MQGASVPITRGQFTTLVLTRLAVQQHCNLQSFCGMVSLHLGEKSETGKLESVFTDISGDSSDDTHNLLAYYLGAKKGIYHITIDVERCRFELQKEA